MFETLVITVTAGLVTVALANAARPAIETPVFLPREPTAAQVDRMAEAVLGTMWTGDAGHIGLSVDRSCWRARFRAGLAAAANEPEA